MRFEESSLMLEMNNVIRSADTYVHGYYNAVIIANGKNIIPHKILNIDNYRDFLKNYTDDIMVECVIPAGVYENDIIPFKENLEVRIYDKPVLLVTDASSNKEYGVMRGRCILEDTGASFFSSKSSANSKKAKDLSNLMTIRFQILDPMVELFRMISVGGIYRNVVGVDLAKTLLMEASNKSDVENEYKIKGIDVVPKYSKEVNSHINIPAGTKLIDLLDYINKNFDGIYPTGLGFYMHKAIWYIYPTFDTSRFDSAKSTLTIIRVPPDVLPAIDKSFTFKNGHLTIISNEDVMFDDKSDIAQHNEGNGLRFADARTMFESFAEVDGNVATISRAKNVSEFVSDNRKTGLNNVVSTTAKITSNMFYEMSSLAKRNGSVMTVHWNYSDANLVHPGMPVKYLYLQGDNVSAIYGVVLAVQETIMLEGQGITANKHRKKCSLSIFVKRELKWNAEANE